MNRSSSDPSLDKFALLDLPRRYALDPAELDRRFRARSREVHPDRFAMAPAAERVKSLQAATAVNDAYKTLRDPVRRAEYLLELEGETPSDDDGVDQAFLTEILELREELLEAKLAGDQTKVGRLRTDMTRRHDEAMAAIARLFGAYEATRDRQRLVEVKRELVGLRYFRRFLDEAEGREAFE